MDVRKSKIEQSRGLFSKPVSAKNPAGVSAYGSDEINGADNTTDAYAISASQPITDDLKSESLVRGIILSEILGPPLSKRRR